MTKEERKKILSFRLWEGYTGRSGKHLKPQVLEQSQSTSGKPNNETEVASCFIGPQIKTNIMKQTINVQPSLEAAPLVQWRYYQCQVIKED